MKAIQEVQGSSRPIAFFMAEGKWLMDKMHIDPIALAGIGVCHGRIRLPFPFYHCVLPAGQSRFPKRDAQPKYSYTITRTSE